MSCAAKAEGLSTLALLEYLRGGIPHLRKWSDDVGCRWLSWFASKGWLAWVEREAQTSSSALTGVVLWRPVNMEQARQSFELEGYHFVNHVGGETVYIDACIAAHDDARVALWERINDRMGARSQVAFHRQHQPGKQLKIYNWDRFNQLIRRARA